MSLFDTQAIQGRTLSNGTVQASIKEFSKDSPPTEASRHLPWLEAIGQTILRFRMPILFIGHSLVFIVSFWIAYCLRFDFAVPAEYVAWFWMALPAVVCAKLIVFSALKSFHGWWRHVTFRDLIALARAVVISFFVIAMIDRFFNFVKIPRAVIILDAICTAVVVGLARSSWRIAREGLWPGVRLPKDCQGALMISNNHEMVMLAHQINATTNAKYRVVGLLTDDEKVIGSTRAGIPLVGKPEDAQTLATRHNASEIWAVAGGIPGSRLRQLKNQLEGSDLNIKIIPPVLSTANDNGQIPIRDIDIRDLLQREAIVLDTLRLSEQISGRRIMVTGAGGSIGSEICRQILRFNPSELVLVDHRENSVFLIHQELSQRAQGTEVVLHPCVGDILDEARMRRLFDTHQPEFVYHAAAHKHVGLMECNAGQAIQNNIFGTKAIADLAKEFEVQKFVLISTDKAVNPTSVMGVTKQIAERYINALAQKSDSTQFIAVRFGNVLGSNGSVVPIFKKQIADGGPITVTDERMTRFFMTIPEASQLVLQAASMGTGGEIFVLEMGDQVKIIELARELIRLAGLPQHAIDIKIVGVRPGEKLFEELYFDEEQMLETDHPKVRAAYHRDYSVEEVLAAIEGLHPFISRSNADVRAKLKEIVPEFNWNPGGLPTSDDAQTTASASASAQPILGQ